ncbi:MAG: superoxide dismutase family protein [Chloroflexota bacterium]|nr:superoxide dismutase family protein [Chloroflexota bacterium]
MRKLYLLLVTMLALGLSTAAFADEGDMVTIDLTGKPGYEGISGTATLTDNGDDTTKVVIELEGTPEGGMHPAHFHDGTDCSQNEPVVHDLGMVENGRAEKMVPESLDDLVEANYYLNVHLSADEIETVVACGDEYVEMPTGTGNQGAGGMSGQNNSLPVMGLGLVAAVFAAGALLAVRARSS